MTKKLKTDVERQLEQKPIEKAVTRIRIRFVNVGDYIQVSPGKFGEVIRISVDGPSEAEVVTFLIRHTYFPMYAPADTQVFVIQNAVR